ncbi:FAD-dependent monooxygenase [Streptomyces sp. NL15-2K]|uniref:FAD-dependent monooxygenase n=1 Tax=Streptomyces sp. NL15-2K TaxID=376149 RepID=UPI000F574990|nr:MULTISPECIES: FAD-dependent monooxygenase [Actinomycetes]WKX13469.1 FAD-dependent monooxygenase [Kutzneria buriramensis]GCB45151.1 monooxygenase [Streptomyces sp. NL15-2K]
MGGTAVVAGGGIGGLAVALGLRRVGWDVSVVERAPVLADVGAGISLHANGLRALDVLGVGQAVRAAARPQYTGGTRTPDGGWLSRMDGAALERELGTPIVGIPRADLHRLLRAALPAECLVVGAEVTTVDRTEPGRVRIPLDDGVLDADLLVAADGVNSRLRTQLFPAHPGPAYSGSTVLRAITEHPVDALSTDFAVTWGPGAEFGHVVFADGRAEWHAVLNSAAGVRHDDPLAAMRRRFRDWHDPIPRLLDATRPDAVLHHDIRELVTPLPSFAVGRIALLGDAAHAMTPNLGQGACQALEDAAVLAAALAAEPTVESALTRYDTQRRPRSQSVARAARQAGRMGQQLTHSMAIALRNTALRLAPSGVTVRAILRHADWKPPRLS